MAARDPASETVALSLALAIIAASPTPLLLLNGELIIIAASRSFRDAFAVAPTDLAGVSLYALGAGEWDTPQLRSFMTTTIASGARSDIHEMDLARPNRPIRHLIVQARRLAYLDLHQIRILLAVTDVTDALADKKLGEDALREKSVLLQDARHRIANSLQIIASVLLQNARRTQSMETRGHLQDAHHRVMSVASLERLLSKGSEEGAVDVQAYFSRLCDSIAASMIGETDQISLSVQGGAGVVEARLSVSLGLIVTELVINALKHAFPRGGPGRIVLDYDFHGPNWVLSVRDDGVGMPMGGDPVRTGLGTSIVQALAKQVGASITTVSESPGVRISIAHTQIALVEDDDEPADKPAAATPASSATSAQQKERP